MKEIELSKNLDEIDTIISSINMLGEELKSTTISRDFFSSIYNAVTDMLFVVDTNGIILDVNNTTKAHLGESIIKKEFFTVCEPIEKSKNFKKIQQELSIKSNTSKFESTFLDRQNNILFTQCIAKQISENDANKYLIIAEDITLKKESEKRIFRAIIETQEKERKRVADDLHDSIGQELSSIKMMLSVAKNQTEPKKKSENLNSIFDILEGSIEELRNICFNLMPSVLDRGGLIFAIEQLIEKINFKINLDTNIEELIVEKTAQVSIYRVVQEFISNTIKHAEAKEINIKITQENKKTHLLLKDDGKGFCLKNPSSFKGRGLNTMQSRIETFGGNFILTSKMGKGTQLKITF